MLFTILHLITCIALVISSVYWKRKAPDRHSIYRQMIPYIASISICGMIVIYLDAVEFIVPEYFGVVRTIDGLSNGYVTWIFSSILFMLIPIFAFIPGIGSHSRALMLIGFIAAIPSISSLVLYTDIEMDISGDGIEGYTTCPVHNLPFSIEKAAPWPEDFAPQRTKEWWDRVSEAKVEYPYAQPFPPKVDNPKILIVIRSYCWKCRDGFNFYISKSKAEGEQAAPSNR